MYALLPKPLYEVLSYTFHLLHLSFVCVDIHVRVCECCLLYYEMNLSHFGGDG